MRRHSATWWQQAVHNKLVAMVLAMVVLVPLIAAPMARRNASIAALAFEGIAIAMLAMLWWKADFNLDRERVMAFFRTGANLPALLFLALAVISCVASPHKNFSAQETLRIGAGVLLYFIVAYQFKRSEHLSKLVDAILFLAISVSLIGFAQYAVTPSQYASGLLGDHQLFGSFLMILLPIVAVVAISEAKPARQLAAQIATVVTIACLLITHARSAWIGAATSVAMLAILTLVVGARRSKISLRKDKIVLPVMLIAVAAGFFLLIWPETSSIVGRATSLSNISEQAGWQYRQNMWRGTLNMIREKPITGHGIGLYPYYQWKYTGSGEPVSLGAIRPGLGDEAHNLYGQTAAELGLPGLLILLAAPVTFLTMGFIRLRKMDAGLRRGLLIGSMAATVAFVVDAIGSPAWQCGQVSMFYWLTLGLGVSCLRIYPKTQEPAPESVPLLVKRRAMAFASIGLAVLLPTVAFAAAPGYNHIVRCRLVPKTSVINGGQSQAYTFLGVFGDANNNVADATEVDLTTNASTQFTFTTSNGNVGFLTGPNNSVYHSDPRGLYTASITGTFNDGVGGTCTDTATLEVLRGTAGNRDLDKDIIYGGVGGFFLFWLFARHGHNDRIDFDNGGGPQTTQSPGQLTGLDSYGEALPDDSPFK